MRKKKMLIIATLVLCSITTTSFSQIRFGFRGEVGLNKPAFSKDVIEVENLNSFKLGPTMEVMLPGMDFGIEGSLLYNNDRMNVLQTGDTPSKIEVTNHYIDIPLNAKMKFGLLLPVKLYAAAGPYAKIHVGGDDIKFGDVTEDVKAKAFEAGVNLGLGIEVIRRLSVGANYGIQLTDNYSVNKPTWSEVFNKKKGLWSIQATLYL